MKYSGTITPPILPPLSLLWYGVGALVIGLLLARWTWILFAPPTLVAPPPDSHAINQTSANLFGLIGISGVTETAGNALSSLHLIGVFSGKQGFAIFRLDEKHQSWVPVGEEISKGVRLIEVAADYTIVENNGFQQRVNLESKSANNLQPSAQPNPLSSSPNGESIVNRWNPSELSNARR